MATEWERTRAEAAALGPDIDWREVEEAYRTGEMTPQREKVLLAQCDLFGEDGNRLLDLHGEHRVRGCPCWDCGGYPLDPGAYEHQRRMDSGLTSEDIALGRMEFGRP